MAGYNPASTTSSNLPQSTVIFHDKDFVKNLKKNLVFLRGAERKSLPLNSGNQLRLYMYQPFVANTQQVAEGTVGSGEVPTVLTTTATIGQWADYLSISDLSMEMSIDDVLANLREEFAYRGALTINTIHRNVLDAGNGDANISVLNKAYNAPIGRADFTDAIQSLQGFDVMPFENGLFPAIIHPFGIGDAINDTSGNGLVDIWKHTTEGQDMLKELPGRDSVPVADVNGCRFYQSTLVTQTINYLGHAGVTAYRSYYLGADSNFAISLGAKEGAKIGDGDWRNLDTWLQRASVPTDSDPARVIGGWTSYNLKYASSLGPDTTARYRTIDAPTNV